MRTFQFKTLDGGLNRLYEVFQDGNNGEYHEWVADFNYAEDAMSFVQTSQGTIIDDGNSEVRE